MASYGGYGSAASVVNDDEGQSYGSGGSDHWLRPGVSEPATRERAGCAINGHIVAVSTAPAASRVPGKAQGPRPLFPGHPFSALARLSGPHGAPHPPYSAHPPVG